MTLRQRILKKVYPFLMLIKNKNSNVSLMNRQEKITPPVSFHSLSFLQNNGAAFSLASLKGKKVMLVNTASDCGYTAQYAELQNLYEANKSTLEIIGFPANDFKEQESGSDADIAQFCSVNFGVSFPLAKKSSVIKSASQNSIFHWLSSANDNGWNSKAPEWNFSKYLVNEQGFLTHYFPPAVSPLSAEVVAAIRQ